MPTGRKPFIKIVAKTLFMNTKFTIFILFFGFQSTSQILLSEFIFEQAPFTSCHASTIVALQGDDLLTAWFGGPREGHPDVAIWYSKKSAGHWSTPQILAKEKNTPCWNP